MQGTLRSIEVVIKKKGSNLTISLDYRLVGKLKKLEGYAKSSGFNILRGEILKENGKQ